MAGHQKPKSVLAFINTDGVLGMQMQRGIFREGGQMFFEKQVLRNRDEDGTEKLFSEALIPSALVLWITG